VGSLLPSNAEPAQGSYKPVSREFVTGEALLRVAGYWSFGGRYVLCLRRFHSELPRQTKPPLWI